MSHDHDTVRTSCLPSPDIAGGTHAPGGPCVRRHHSLLRQSQRNLPSRPRRRAHARPRLAAHVCGITGSRRDELALRRQWHVVIAAGAASGMSGSWRAPPVACRVQSGSRRAPPVACRDRGGRRQWHVGRDRGGLALCRSRFVRTTVAGGGCVNLRALRPTCVRRIAAGRGYDEHARYAARASRPHSQPSVEG